MERRFFLQQAINTIGAASFFGAFELSAKESLVELELPAEFYEIDRNKIVHQIRDGAKFSVPDAKEKFDVIIIGGGISGLTSFFHLQDMTCLLLEKEPVLGGNSRRLKINDIYCPLGAVLSQGSIEPFTNFFSEIKTEFTKVPAPEFSLQYEGKIYREPFGKDAPNLPFSDSVKKQFQELPQKLHKYLDPKSGVFYPKQDNSAEILKLCHITLKDFFEDWNIDSQLLQVIDCILHSRIGSDSSQIAAWEGLYILSNHFAPMYSLPGGHGAISEAILNSIEQRHYENLRTSHTVVEIEDGPNGVKVGYLDENGKLKAAQAKCAIVCSPKLIAKHLIKKLPQERYDVFKKNRYSPFLVAQVSFSKPVMESFEILNPNLFSKLMLRPDWLANNQSKNGNSHITVYVPMIESVGRANLLAQPPKYWAELIYKDLKTVFKEKAKYIENMLLHRWGHPMLLPTIDRDKEIAESSKPMGNIIFGHSDSFGISGLYSAVWTGMNAYSDVLMHSEDWE